MPLPRFTKPELQVMESLWTRGASSVREIQEGLPTKERPAYTTVQTVVYRLEAKKAVRRVKKVGNAHVFEAAVTRERAHRRIVDDLLALFGGRVQPMVSHLIESGRLTLDDVEAARRTLRRLERDDVARRAATGRKEQA
ncbi:MAG: BlaI/MecI/CopY family transcriptional regulator [Vicinamibacterales bacterium]